jgi:hypothetical protein
VQAFAALFIVLAATALIGLRLQQTTSRAAGEFTVHVAPAPVADGVESSQFGNDSYNSLKTQLTDYQASQGEVTFVFSALTASKLTGLPALTGDANSATAYFDDSAFDITVIFDTTYLEQDVQVLISARWTNGGLDFEPELAVVLRIDAIDLTSLNASWDAFPVNFSNVLVGFSNVDHTLVEAVTMGTDQFFEDGIPDAPSALDDTFRIIPGGAGLQAALDDDPAGADPLLEGAGLLGAVDKIVIRGSAGKIPGAEEDSTIKALDLTASVAVSTPPSLQETGVTLDSVWSLQIRADTGGSFFGRLAGNAKVTLGTSETTFGAALNITHTKATGTTGATTSFKLEGSVGDLEDLFGQTWLDLKQVAVSATLTRDTSKTPPQTIVAMTMTTKLTLGGVALTGTLSAKTNLTNGETELGVTLGVAGNVKIADILTALNAPTVDDGVKVELTGFGLNVTVKKPATGTTTVTVTATGAASMLGRTCGTAPNATTYPPGTASLLFRLQLGGTTTNLLVGASVKGLNTKNLDCAIPFAWTLPDVMLLLSNNDMTTGWAGVDTPTKTFLEHYFCGTMGATTPCNDLQRVICPLNSTLPCTAGQQNLTIKTGLTLHALVTIDGDLAKALAEIEIVISPTDKLRVTGTVPLFGGTDVALSVALPTITNPNQDALVASANVLLEFTGSSTAVAAKVAGQMTFRVERANQTTCDQEGLEADGDLSSGKCYDELSLTVGFEIEVATTPPSFKLTGFAVLGNWQNAFGEPNLTVESFALEITIEGPLFVLGVGMGGKFIIGETELTLAITVKVTATPPSIALTGLTVGSPQGLNLRDIVKAFAPDLDEEALPPDLSLKNIWFAYGTENNNTLCIRQGLFISAELHLNDPDPNSGKGTNPACGGTAFPVPDCGQGGEASCLAAITLDIKPQKFFLQGQIAAFNLGPLAFQDTKVLIDLSLIKQEISFSGGATLYDPVLWYLADPDGSGTIPVWASAFVSLEVKHNAGVFTLSFDGCALLGGTAEAGPDCPTSSTTVLQVHLDASLTVDFKKVGLAFFEDAQGEITASISAPALGQLLKDIEAGLEPAATFFDDAGTALEGTTAEVVSAVETHFCLAFNLDCPELDVTADAYTNAPAYIDAQINATDVAIDNSTAVDFHCFFQVGIPTTPCVDEFRNDARAANETTIAAHGGRLYIALHGINATGFGGIVDSLDSNIVYVNPTTFNWPNDGTPALCGVGGELQGFALCSIPKGQPLVLDEVISAALLEALRDLDPELVALFEESDSQALVTAAGGMSLTQTTGVDLTEFLADVKKLGAAFDLNKPLAVCEAKATFTFSPTTGLGGSTDFQTKIDAYGGKAIVSAKPVIGGGTATLDELDVKTGVITDVLDSAVTDLECPVATLAGELSFSMSATSINEGDTLTLTGKATAGATVTVDWGDDSTDSTATAEGNGEWTASHKYLDGPKVHGVIATTPNAPDAAAILSVNNVKPNITGVTAPGDANEGGEVTLAGTYTDPGTLDTHTLLVNWGDGTSSEVSLAADAESFSLMHKYVDDNPTGTVQDTHVIGITITDKDTGKDTDSTSSLVRNLAPTDLSLDSASWAGGTATRDTDGNLVVPEGTAVTFSGTFRDPGTADTHLISIYWNGGQVEQQVAVTVDPLDPMLKRFTVARIFADDHPATGTPSDLVLVGLQVRDDDTGTASADLKVRVQNVVPTLSSGPASQEVQYSDPVANLTFTASDVKGFAGAGGTLSENLVASTRWSVDSGDWEDGLFGDLALTAQACEFSGTDGTARQTCEWSVEGLVDVAPGVYVIEFTVTDDDTGATTETVEITVLPEDARATYTGPRLVSAPSLATGSVEVMLRATVQDISVVDPADAHPGDITNAELTFINRETGDELCTADVVPIFVGDTTTGGASCLATLTLAAGESIDTVIVGLVVGGWYARDDESENAGVTIEKPTGDWVTGSDLIVAPAAGGTYAPSSNPEINVSTAWKNGLSELTGKLRIRFTSGGRTYEVSVTSFDSIGTKDGGGGKSGQAEIEARATLYDITVSPDNPVTVATGLRLQFRLGDTTTKADTASFALWASDGLLVAGSGWNGVMVPMDPLQSGKLQVHFD